MKKLLLIVPLMLFAVLVSGQSRRISGKVTERANGAPLPGVSIIVIETSRSTSTDADGVFSIDAETGQRLKVSYIGMKTDSITIGSNVNNLVIRMEEEQSVLEQVVVTGYQTQRKADLTGAVSVVDVGDIEDIPLGNPVKAMQGRVPGVTITTSGAPSGGATVRIRGVGTLGNSDPLYVIDGIPTKRGLQELNPDDVESIQVLKDASSATMYGSRAANGVIIVTTKKAKTGVTRINFDASASLQNYSSKLSPLNTNGRGEAYWRASVNDRTNPNNHPIYQFDWNNDFNNPVLNNVNLPEFIDEANTMRPADTRWFDEVSQNSLLQYYNLSISNGTEKGNALVALSYYDNQGIIKNSGNRKLTARINSDYSLLKNKLKVGENFSATFMRDVLVPSEEVTHLALIQQPVVPVYTVNGGWGGPAPGMTDRHNPVRLLEDNRQNKSNFYRIFGNAYADLTVIPNLHLRTSFGIDYNGNYARTLRKSYVSGFLIDPSNMVSTSQAYDGNLIWQNTLTYNLESNKHRVDFLAGHEQIKYINQNFLASARGLALENIDYAYLGAGTSDKINEGGGSSNSLLSYFAKVNYSFDNRYLASATIRRDGSSRFGEENRFGYFPAFSLGWRISEEAFMKSIPVVSDLKLRYGWGKSGNQEIANNAAYSLYAAIYEVRERQWNFDSGSAYDIGGTGTGQLPSGYTAIQQGNDQLKWEATTESNFGVDFGFLGNRITGSADYFIKKTSDILIRPAYLAVIGEGGDRWANGASMENKGFEFLLSYDGKVNDLAYSITGNFSTYKNKITALPSEILTSYPGNGTDKNILGRSVRSIFGYVADGLFQSQEEVEAHANQPGKGLGRIRYRDLNGDNLIDDKDRDYLGQPDPNFAYGLNTSLAYKNFDLNFFLQGVQGLDVYNTYKTFTDFSSIWAGTNWGTRTLEAWTPQNTSSTIPALTVVDRNNENRTSTYFIENGSYLKLRNLQLGYTFKNTLRKLSVQSMRVYLQGSNLFTIKSKNYTAPDPENPNTIYPIPVITTLGLNVSF